MTLLKPSGTFTLFSMTEQYETLHILYEIAEASLKPTQYQCTPRELILNSKSDWAKINEDMNTLAAEGLVLITPGSTPLFTITAKGLNKILTLKGLPAIHKA